MFAIALVLIFLCSGQMSDQQGDKSFYAKLRSALSDLCIFKLVYP